VQTGIDEMADRVLSGVQEKLDTRLSISYTVNDLILQARDLYHLSSIYVRSKSPLMVAPERC